jgi:small-conductance mechanosensitive channel
MNIIRKLILLITALIIALWCFFPPTYGFGHQRVDVARLWARCVGIAVVGGVLYSILGKRKHNKKDNKERTNTVGPIETAIRKRFTHSERLYTPAKKRPFEIVVKQDAPNDKLLLLLGRKRTPTSIRWEYLEGIPDFLKGKDWVRIGGR